MSYGISMASELSLVLDTVGAGLWSGQGFNGNRVFCAFSLSRPPVKGNGFSSRRPALCESPPSLMFHTHFKRRSYLLRANLQYFPRRHCLGKFLSVILSVGSILSNVFGLKRKSDSSRFEVIKEGPKSRRRRTLPILLISSLS